jgi:membrane-bound lytic murein transglycosylase D
LLSVIPIALASCAIIPPKSLHEPVVEVTPKITIDKAAATGSGTPIAAAPANDLWSRLRGSFAMADCNADPAITMWAKRYTQNPRRFETQMGELLPQLAYVQQVAADHGVPGEFALLPWVESGFQAAPARRNRPAGIWQIVPVTAASMGLRMDARYDGRFDLPASTQAVMKILRLYHDQFHDWRVADYAYNAGEFRIRQIIEKQGMPPDVPITPRWPVRGVTREHLSKLLAIACVVREPGRFNIELPQLAADQHLVQVGVAHTMPIAQAARHAGMSVDILSGLNRAFRNGVVDAGASPYLMLPANHVQQFRAAMLQPASTTVVAQSAVPVAPLGEVASTAPATKMAPAHPAGNTHKVKRGESLWQIARRYSLNVGQLQRWNHLHGVVLKPGQLLNLSSTD